MTTIVRKICLLGDIAVGKTSTVRRFVTAQYDDKYLTTVGVKVDTKEMVVDGQELKLVIWDIAGTDTDPAAPGPYLRGMSAYVLVADGTRPETLETAKKIQATVREQMPDLPWVGLLNKDDLLSDWRLGETQIQELGPRWRRTSAKSGHNVAAAFEELAQCLI